MLEELGVNITNEATMNQISDGNMLSIICNMINHRWSEWAYMRNTCTMARLCKVCGASDLKQGHDPCDHKPRQRGQAANDVLGLDRSGFHWTAPIHSSIV